MRAKNEKLLSITQNPTEFSEKLLQLIVDDSELSCKRLIALIKRAENNYGSPVKSQLTGWFYSNFRLRGGEVDETRKEMEQIPKALERAHEFKSLIEKGEWNKNSSFNYFLFVELIHAIPGYKPLELKRYPEMVNVLKVILTSQLEGYIKDCETSAKFAKTNNTELGAIAKRNEPSVEKVFVTNCLQTAQKLAVERKDSTFFFLLKSESEWRFSWIDNTGKEYPLEVNEETLSLLSSQKANDISGLKSEHYKRLKLQCLKVKDAFLEKTKVLINPQESKKTLSNEALVEKGIHSAFILRGKPNNYQLWWVNSLGKVSEIDLVQYPQLTTWLSLHTELEDDYLSQLKMHLLHVNTRQSVGREDIKKLLSNHLLHLTEPSSKKSITLNPKPLDLKLFSSIERCLGNRLGEPLKEKAQPGQLDLSQYDALSNCLSRRPKENIELTEDELLTLAKINVDDAPIQAKESIIPGQLDLSQFAAVSNFFSQRPKEKPLTVDETSVQVTPNLL